jgi:acetyltransferase-like isoleucine patch superfamily enzyme
MIRLGLNTDKFSASNGSALLIVKGTLIFKGAALISVDYTFDIIGTCILGDMVGLGNSVRIRCWEKVEIGKGSRITANSQIFDTNFHYTRNVETGEIARARKAIYIGRFCWIGNRTTIMMGTYLPDYSIVAGNSLVNKKYIKDIPNYPMFAGIPAKLIRAGYVRVFDIKLETEVNDYFKNTPTSNIYHAQSGFIDESEEIANAFRWFYR